ncbi:MAG: hypothetical protein AAF645_15630 [Myxococcota bacterium]
MARALGLLGKIATVVTALSVLLAGRAQGWHRLEPGSESWRGPAIRGITVGPIESSLHPGVGYGTAASARTFTYLEEMGANWVSITPFGRLWSLSSTEIEMDFEATYEDNRANVRRAIRQAKARGQRVLLIPHLWIETTGWRGEIDPGDDARWEAYQASYRRFVLAWAADAEAAGADAFSIGVECKSWSGRFGGFWIDLIEEVRRTFSGLLTYSANWDEAENVLFWDQLDLIGINAFYPLAQEPGATDAQYREGAEALVPGVRELALTLQMPLAFVELGYTTRTDAAIEPWLWPDDMADVAYDEREQARALDALISAFQDERWFAGFFLWRYYADLYDVSQEAEWGFSTFGKEGDEVLRRSFAAPFGADPRLETLPVFAPSADL